MNALPSHRHGNLTYAGLLERLKTATVDELNQTVTVYVPDMDEYYPVVDTDTVSETDTLDEGHLFLKVG